jgi:hypothetical protein
MAFVVLTALRHALNSARQDSEITEDVFYHLGAPTTPENILLAGNSSIEQYLCTE